MTNDDARRQENNAELYRMVTAEHICPFGLKSKDLKSFSNMFLNYDLLAQRWVPYSYVYPFVETLAGILMLASVLI